MFACEDPYFLYIIMLSTTKLEPSSLGLKHQLTN